MKSNGLWKQQWKFEVSASSVKAAAQQHALPSYGELDAKVLHPVLSLCNINQLYLSYILPINYLSIIYIKGTI